MGKVLTLFSTGRRTTAKLGGILKDNSAVEGQPERGFMHRCWPVAACIAISLVVGCGKSDTAPSPQASKTSKNGAAKIAKVDCPSKFEFPDRPTGAPVDDILGMRQGAKLSDAMLFLKCRPETHVVFAEENIGIIKNVHGQKFRQVVTATDGVPRARPYDYVKAMRSGETGTPEFDFVAEKVMFWSLGLQDKEIVWGIWRTQYYKPGEQPPVGALAEQLSAKYGRPNSMQEDNRASQLAWLYDSYRRPISNANTNQLNHCRDIGRVIEGDHQIYGECGLTITAYIEKANNPLLADKVHVAIIDQGRYMSATTEFEQTLAAVQTQQQSGGATKAAKSLPATKF